MNWKQNIIIAILLVMIGIVGRITLHDVFSGINNPLSTTGYLVPLDMFFIIAGISLYSGIFLNKYYTLFIPLCIIGLTDIFYAIIEPSSVALWTTWLFLFTWSGYAIISSLGFTLKKKSIKIPTLMGIGVLGVLLYDIWTNFGFWLTYSKLGFYTQDIYGLSMVYIGGLPTMIWHLLSTSIFIGCTGYLIKNRNILKNIDVKPKEKYNLLAILCVLILSSLISIGI